jgi:hypothetical protein
MTYFLHRGVGRGAGLGRGLGVGEHLPAHGVAVGVGVGLTVGVGVGVGAPTQYFPPVLKRTKFSSRPPHTIISLSVQMAV